MNAAGGPVPALHYAPILLSHRTPRGGTQKPGGAVLMVTASLPRRREHGQHVPGRVVVIHGDVEAAFGAVCAAADDGQATRWVAKCTSRSHIAD